MPSEREKMMAGAWYRCLDPELERLRAAARAACHAHRVMEPSARGPMAPQLAALFAEAHETAFVEAPFHCSYGINIHLGAAVYLNAGCTILDSTTVRIEAGAMLGPGVQIYCAQHHKDRHLRAEGQEIALPVTIGADAWIGGGAILMPGVAVGEAAIVGAGAVVTRDVAPGGTVAGNPARPLP